MSVYQPGDFVWALYNGEWYEAEIEAVEGEGVYTVYYEEYDDSATETYLYEIKDWHEGETEPPPDGPNQANAPEYTEEYDENWEEEEEDAEGEYTEEAKVTGITSVKSSTAVNKQDKGVTSVTSSTAVNKQDKQVINITSDTAVNNQDKGVTSVTSDTSVNKQDKGIAQKKPIEAEKEVTQIKKTPEVKAKIIPRAPTVAKENRLFDAAEEAERRKSQKREELDAKFNFAPKMVTRGASFNPDTKSSDRTSNLYEHGKNKQHAELRRSYSVQEKSSMKAKSKTKDDGNGTGDDRINRLYEAGKEREMIKLQKEDAEKEITQLENSSASYDARLGFDKTNTGLGQDLVTNGARSNVLYDEAQMRENKKQQAREEEEKKKKAESFKPKLFTKKSSTSERTVMEGDVSSRLYKDGASRAKKLEQKQKEKENEVELHSFAPNISASQRNCESSSLPRARHEALFLKAEELRMKKEEMQDNYVDGKEVDDLTFTPAVNYHYNDELLAHDTTDFTERLYRTDFAGSKQREEENAEYQDHQFVECTFTPVLTSKQSIKIDDEGGSGKSRIDKLYKDAEKVKKKKEEKVAELQRKDSSRKLRLATKKSQVFDDEDDQIQKKGNEKDTSIEPVEVPNEEAGSLPVVGNQVLAKVRDGDYKGIVRFIGATEFAKGIWCGMELETPEGKNDGTVKGQRYFSCSTNYGLFVRPNQLTILESSSQPELAKKKEKEEVEVAPKKKASSKMGGMLMSAHRKGDLEKAVIEMEDSGAIDESLIRQSTESILQPTESFREPTDLPPLCCLMSAVVESEVMTAYRPDVGVVGESLIFEKSLGSNNVTREFFLAAENEYGMIDKKGVVVAMSVLGLTPLEEELDNVFEQYNTDELNYIEFDQFVRDHLYTKYKECLIEVKSRRGQEEKGIKVEIAAHLQHLEALQTQLQLAVRANEYEIALELEENIQHVQDELNSFKRQLKSDMDEEEIYTELLWMQEESLQYSAELRKAANNEMSFDEFDQFINDPLHAKFEECTIEVKSKRQTVNKGTKVEIATHLQHLKALQTQLQLMVRMKKNDVAVELVENVQKIQKELALLKRQQLEESGMDEEDMHGALECMEEVLQYSGCLRRSLMDLADSHEALLMILGPLLDEVSGNSFLEEEEPNHGEEEEEEEEEA